MSIEEIILSHDRRGISALRGYLPANFCDQAASFVLEKRKENRRPAIITTGFYILSAGATETDGPPGALAIGGTLQSLGFDVFYVVDKYVSPLLSDSTVNADRIIDFPITDHDSSRRFALELLKDIQPSLLISIERCGLNADRQYLNMTGKDVSDYTAKVDYLFMEQTDTLGIGDGGNEIGMGNVAQHIPAVATLPDKPALTPVNKLIIASVSNWGGYGLVAALSRLTNKNLLPTVEWEKETIKDIVARGAVDGVSGQSRNAVDDFDLEQNSWALTQLHRFVGNS